MWWKTTLLQVEFLTREKQASCGSREGLLQARPLGSLKRRKKTRMPTRANSSAPITLPVIVYSPSDLVGRERDINRHRFLGLVVRGDSESIGLPLV